MPYVFFAWPGLEARLAERRRLLVAGERRRSGSGGRRAPASVSPKTPDVGRTSGRIAGRHADELEQLVVPGEPMDVEQQRPAGVRDVGRVDAAAVPPVSRQSRNASTVPKASSPRSARDASAGHGVEDVRDLRAREVRVERQAGPLPEQRLVAGRRAGARRRAR